MELSYNILITNRINKQLKNYKHIYMNIWKDNAFHIILIYAIREDVW